MAKPTTCSECGLPCMQSCPYCKLLVHNHYGQWSNGSCALQHETKCPEGKRLAEDREHRS